jgi:transposase-like protein
MHKEAETKFSDKFKEDAVSRVVLSCDNIQPYTVACEIGVSEQELFKWIDEFGRTRIRYWSIRFKHNYEVGCCFRVPTKAFARRIAVVAHHILEQMVYLRRPNEKPCVGIIQKKDDGTIELNPNVKLNPEGFEESQIVGFDYGPIPPLSKLTPEQADELWGTEGFVTVVGGNRTYRLVTTANEDVVLETVFNGNRLDKYRVLCDAIPSSEWYRPVQEKGACPFFS